MTIVVRRSRPITVLADGVSIETRSQAETVGEALAEVGVALNGLDYTLPSEVAMLRPDMTIEVVRVTEDVVTEQIAVPFETVYQADAALELDQTALVQDGTLGVDQRNIRVRYENGVEISRTDEGVMRMQEPVNRVVSYGTQIVLRTIDTPEGPREYWRKLRLYATSYHPAALGGDDVTATGRKLVKGIVGIDPKLIPYSTTLYVEGYGVGLAADTGGPRSSRYWIDLGYSDADWVSWSRWVDAYLLAPPPENFPYILP
jgi:3D (Asp-Asp-Asp) domain-containing protein